jgi:hypothetical protein
MLSSPTPERAMRQDLTRPLPPRNVLLVALALATLVGALIGVVTFPRRRGPEQPRAASAPAPSYRPAGERRTGSERRTQHGSGPPRFVRTAATDEGVPENDPTQPGYDAVKLSRLHGASTTRDIFAAEPVDPQWSTPMQGRLGEILASEISRSGAQAHVTSIECHTMSCKVVLGTEIKGELDKVTDAIQQAPIAKVIAFVGSSPTEAKIIVLFDPKTRRLEDHGKWYAAGRERAGLSKTD